MKRHADDRSKKGANSANQIQPFGFLAVVEPKSRSIVRISANAGDFTGIEPQDLLGTRIDYLFKAKRKMPMREILESVPCLDR